MRTGQPPHGARTRQTGWKRDNRRWARRIAPALIAALAVVFTSSAAMALTRDELIELKRNKVPDSVVANLVKTSGPINLSEEDVAELKKLGAGDGLIKTLRDNGHVLVSATPDPNGTGGGGEPAPAENDPDAIAAEEARRKAEQEAKIQAEVERRRKEDEARKTKEAEMNRRMVQIEGALRQVRNGENMPAAKTCLEFMALDPPKDSAAYYEAAFCLAKALYQAKVYSGAAEWTLDVVMQGPEKPHFVEAFNMLRVLTRENGFAPPKLEELTKFYVENLDPGFQDEYNYYLGRFFYDYRKLDLAFKYLDLVSEDSKVKPRALYLKGVAQINPEVRKYRSAVENFQKAILAAERKQTADPEIRELAYMALARVAYEATNYDGALYYYNKVSRDSPRRSTAIFESSWTYFLKNDYKRALGAFHSLQSPYFVQWYYPDMYVLEATVYLNLCKFGNAKEALAAFKQRYLDVQPLLASYLQETTDPKAFYETIIKAYGKGEKAEAEAGLPMIFIQAVLNDATFFNHYRIITNLSREQKALESNLDRLGEFGERVFKQVKSTRQKRLNAAGVDIQQILVRLNTELDDWSVKSEEIAFEIDKARADELKAKLQNPDYKAGEAASGTTLFVVADDWQFWPFEGEYWADEVPNYRSFIQTQCVEPSASR